jgi:23S rRNA (guanosine2251-2'-O)-methyltransferase
MKPPRDHRPGGHRPDESRPGGPGGSGPHRGPGHPRPERQDERREPGRGGPGERGGPRHPRPASARPQDAPRGYSQNSSRSRPAEAPRNTVWLYGQHAVAAALANPARRLRRLLLTEEAATSLAERLRQPWAIPHETVERARLDHLLGRDVVHQGLALLADPLGTPSLQHALERPGPVVVLDQVTDPRNVGAILRSAAAFGASTVIAQERNAPEETGALAKAASGALETVPLLRAVNIARTLVALKAAGVWMVGLDAGGAAKLSGPALMGRRVGLVLGAEGAGLRRLTRETCDEVAGLAIKGAMESLNVAAAAAVALYEVTRQP